jgi:hypothetical protein
MREQPSIVQYENYLKFCYAHLFEDSLEYVLELP